MAVYTFLSDGEIAAHLTAHYGLGRFIRADGITSGVENTNYRLETDRGLFILTLFEKRTKAEDLPFFMALNAHLKNKGLPTAAPVLGQDGGTLYTLKDKSSVVMPFLPGRGIEPATLDTCQAAGVMLARLHLAGQDFKQQRVNAMNPVEWRRLIEASGAKAGRFEAGLAASLLEMLDSVTPAWNPSTPSGVLHGDYFPDNVFFAADGKTVSGIIDFYFACSGAFVYDLMLALHPWCGPDGMIEAGRARAFFAGYQSVRPLTADETKTLSTQGALSALRIAATRLYDALHHDPKAQVVAKDPMPYVRLARWHLSASGQAALADWSRRA